MAELVTTYVALSTPGVLLSDAADAFERARLHLAIRGVESGTTNTLHATRTYDEQVALFRARYRAQAAGAGAYGDVRWWNGVRYVRTSSLGSAAVPGTSNHGTGRTVDWQNLGEYATDTWARAAAFLTAHGWDNTEGRKVNEPWHWTYNAARDNQGGADMADLIQLLKDIRTTQLEDSTTFRTDLVPSVRSMHRGKFLPISGGPGGDLSWLDVKLAALVPTIVAEVARQVQSGTGTIDQDAMNRAALEAVRQAFATLANGS